jgi:drug/metabolite transporter (DMT)-like permease
MNVAAGIALAAGAAACFDGAVALQALEARAVGDALVRGLLSRPRWLAATALAIAGWPLQVAALSLAPITVVQPALALGLVLLLVLGNRLLHEPMRPRDLVAVGAIAAGLALLAWAAPEAEHVRAGDGTLAVALGALGAAAIVPWLARGRLPGTALVVAAGLGYAGSGLGSKLLADALWGAPALLWAAITAVLAGAGLFDEMAALQRVGAARVAAGAFALQTVVPVVLAPALTGEHWSRPAAILAGLVLVVGGSLGLGTATAVRGLVAH